MLNFENLLNFSEADNYLNHGEIDTAALEAAKVKKNLKSNAKTNEQKKIDERRAKKLTKAKYRKKYLDKLLEKEIRLDVTKHLPEEIKFIVAFDLECSGFVEDDIIEIAAVKINLQTGETNTFEELIAPRHHLNSRVVSLTGIHKEDLKGKRTLKEVLPEFIHFIEKDSCLVVGHSILQNDLVYLNFALHRYGFEKQRQKFFVPFFIDTERMAQRYFRNKKNAPRFNQEALLHFFGFHQKEIHRAFSDAFGAYVLMKAMLCQIDFDRFHSFPEVKNFLNEYIQEVATMKKRPIMLIIMDGWGNGDVTSPDNAIARANTPNFDALQKKYPVTQLLCSGEDVGLPDGQMGNSEVGHTNIGAGRIVYQDLTKITKAIREKTFFDNAALNHVIDTAKNKNGALHLFGLLSDGGVHSHLNHLLALIDLAKNKNVKKIYVHAFLDGRDVPPSSAEKFLSVIENLENEQIQIATISGRFYAMDRDKRWARIQKAYEAIAYGVCDEKFLQANQAIQNSYKNNLTDEFVVPTVREGYPGMKPEDSVIFYNFRPDRARELTHAFTDEIFEGFSRDEALRKNEDNYATMTQYEAGLHVAIAYPPEDLVNTLGEVIEKSHLKQLRIAETEKYAHVTFFFNGGKEQPYENEDRILVPSPKVATYDLQPEMSAIEVCDKVCKAIQEKKYDFIILNFANGDMVGHTGIFEAAVKAVETVDSCIGRCVKEILNVDGVLFVTADHGNAEQMIDKETGQPFTQHTTNPVPLIVISNDLKINLRDGGRLCDLAPTMLTVAGLSIPKEMTGKSLI